MTIIPVDHLMRTDPTRARLAHEEKYEKGCGFSNGEYCALAELVVPLLDHGFVFADAVYEKLTVAKGRYFRLQDHLDRFARSCAKFRLRNPYTNEEMLGIFNQLLIERVGRPAAE